MSHTNDQSSNPTTPRIGCNDLKAALSAYIDGELTRDERLRADAHLIGCGSCRNLVERAENLDQTLREKFERDTTEAASELGSATIDTRAMQASVLAAIGAERPVRRWFPRLAVAAAAAIAALAGFMLLRAPDEVTESATSRRIASLDDADRQLLYSTGVILTNLRKERSGGPLGHDQLRGVAVYDELIERLDDLVSRVSPEDRVTLALARQSIEILVSEPDNSERWQKLQRDLERTELDRKVDRLSEV